MIKNWDKFLNIFSENRKKETSFADLVRLIHQELPLNIISQLVNVDKIEYEEMTKILRNTLTDKGTFFCVRQRQNVLDASLFNRNQ